MKACYIFFYPNRKWKIGSKSSFQLGSVDKAAQKRDQRVVADPRALSSSGLWIKLLRREAREL